MTPIEIFSEIKARQIDGVMFHDELSTLYDFMALRGYKRMHEYQALKEFCEMRGVSRYAVNHLNKMLADSSHSPIRITPTSWKSASRFDMGENDRKAYIKEFFKKWREWEIQTKAFYENKFKELTDGGYIACANKINELIRDVDKELKCLEREFLTISSTGFDMLFIASRQDELHKFYEEQEKAIGVEFN